MTLLPRAEERALLRDVADAVSLADAGERQDGITVLREGLRRASELPGSTPWAGELARRYRVALKGFCSLYGCVDQAAAVRAAPPEPLLGELLVERGRDDYRVPPEPLPAWPPASV